MNSEPPGSGPATSPTVVVDDERADPEAGPPVDADRWMSLIDDVLDAEGLGGRPVEVHVHFVDEAPMADLNATHLGGDGPTDVLSFPVDVPAEVPDGLPVLLGDVVVCPAVADRQAVGHAGDYPSAVALLLVHGVLHLLGHDHAGPDEESAMQARERRHLARHGVDRP